MVIVRIVAVLVGIAAVLGLLYLVTRKPALLTWAWRFFVLSLAGMVGVLAFYFVERLFFVG